MKQVRCQWFGRALLLPVLFLTGMMGCAASVPVEDLVAVSGDIIFDDNPVERAVVTFIPSGKNTKAHVGRGVTDTDGHFEIFNYQQKSGIPAGEYIVTVSLKLRRDGSLPALDNKAELTGLKEAIPAPWSVVSKAGRHNMVTVPEDGKTDFVFKLPKAMSDSEILPPASAAGAGKKKLPRHQ